MKKFYDMNLLAVHVILQMCVYCINLYYQLRCILPLYSSFNSKMGRAGDIDVYGIYGFD